MAYRDEVPDRSSDDRSVWLLRILGAAVLLGVLLSVQALIEMRRAGRSDPFVRILLVTMPDWLLWAGAAPIVLTSTRVIRSAHPAHRASRMAWLIGVAVALMLTHSAVLYVWQRAFSLTDLQWPLWKGALAIARWHLPTNLLVYGALLGVEYSNESTRRAAEAMREAHERELLTARISEQLATARLHALRMQLNPHFLFNALNTVAMLVRRGDGASAVRVLAGLSDLLRHLLADAAGAEVTLDEELDVVRKYLDIEHARFGDGLRIAFDVAPDTLRARVPSLILQPIVENAVRHGAALAADRGSVRIRTSRRGDALILEVADNGPGVRSDGESDGDGTGVGIRTTVERLTHLHGDNFDFELRNQTVGAVATIVLPFSAAPAAAHPA